MISWIVVFIMSLSPAEMGFTDLFIADGGTIYSPDTNSGACTYLFGAMLMLESV